MHLILDEKNKWRGHRISWCSGCKTFSMICEKCSGSTCNGHFCDFCGKDQEDFINFKPSLYSHITKEEAETIEKTERIKDILFRIITEVRLEESLFCEADYERFDDEAIKNFESLYKFVRV